MALYAIEGNVGGGKSFCAVNAILPDYLLYTERHVYTNLPIDGDELEYYLSWLTKSPVKQEAIRARLHFLKPGRKEAFQSYWAVPVWYNQRGELLSKDLWPRNEEKALARGWRKEWAECAWPEDAGAEAALLAQGAVKQQRSLGEHDQLSEFWFFTEPNALIFLDETADIFNALDAKGKRSDTLQSYINHHRHYRDDLYFFMQSREDIDVQIRRKILYVFYVENQKTRPMFKHWSMRGLRWPIQHFLVSQYLGRHVLGKGGNFDQFEPMRSYRVWPTRRKFKNYRSFSQAATLPGKRTAAAQAKSSDMDSPWDRIKDWLATAWAPLGTVLAIAVFTFMVIRMVYAMAGLDSGTVGKWLGTERQSKQQTQKGTNASVRVVSSTVGGLTNQPSGGAGAAPAATNSIAAGRGAPEPERVVLVTPKWAQTSEGRRFSLGSEVGGRRVSRVCLNGLEFEDGGSVLYGLLLRSRQGESF